MHWFWNTKGRYFVVAGALMTSLSCVPIDANMDAKQADVSETRDAFSSVDNNASDRQNVDGAQEADSQSADADTQADAGTQNDVQVDASTTDSSIADAASFDLAEFVYPHCGSGYCFRQFVELPRYLWHLACVDGQLYSGTYGDPSNVFYSVNSQGQSASLEIDQNAESTRVYNMNGAFYATSEGGAVFFDNAVRGDLGGHYVLAGSFYHAAQDLYLVARAPRNDDSTGQLYNCQGSTCSFWGGAAQLRPYHLAVFNDELYVMGRTPKGTSGSYNAGNARVMRWGAGMVLSETSNGIAVRGTAYDGRLYVGITNNARVASFDGSTWRAEINLPAFEHLGDMVEYQGHLFVAVVKDGGSAELWRKDGGEGVWNKVFSTEDLAGYGVLSGIPLNGEMIVLNNAAGFLTSCNDKLYLSLNTPTSMRQGPGYILEIVARP
jgi:hypothetical protein